MKSKYKIYIRYFKYVLRHKFFVALECFKNGLYWRGLCHDISKFLPSECIAYANFFSGDANNRNLFLEKFNYAWLTHQHRNKHHWQYWILHTDTGKVIPLEITKTDRKYFKIYINFLLDKDDQRLP